MAWWHVPVILALGRSKQKDKGLGFQGSLDFTVTARPTGLHSEALFPITINRQTKGR